MPACADEIDGFRRGLAPGGHATARDAMEGRTPVWASDQGSALLRRERGLLHVAKAEMIANVTRTTMIKIGDAAARHPSAMASLVTSLSSIHADQKSASTAVMMTVVKAVNQVRLTRTEATANARMMSPKGVTKNKTTSSNGPTGPSEGFQSGRTLSQTSAIAPVGRNPPISAPSVRFIRRISMSSGRQPRSGESRRSFLQARPAEKSERSLWQMERRQHRSGSLASKSHSASC